MRLRAKIKKDMPSVQVLNRKRGKAPLGFSLIEVLLVVAIIGLLVSISIVSYQSYQNKTKKGIVESVLLSAQSIVLDNQNYGIKTTRGELNEMIVPQKQHKEAVKSDPSSKIGQWKIRVEGESNPSFIPIDKSKAWCLQINLGDLSYEGKASCIDSRAVIKHTNSPDSSEKGRCQKTGAKWECKN